MIARLKQHCPKQPSDTPEFDAFIAGLTIDENSKANLRQFGDEFFSRLAHIKDKSEKEQIVGLLLGYVQGGKTTYFLGLTALALDMGYRMIIIQTGTKQNIDSQARTELHDKLFANRQTHNLAQIEWDNHASTKNKLDSLIDQQADPLVADELKPAIIITTLKNHQKIKTLAEKLKTVDLLDYYDVLVIDDESDQAGLNNNARKGGARSSTNQHITDLREALPKHVYLQVTATPQAPLMLDLLDDLSPDMAMVLKPGQDYIGGYELFASANRGNYIRTIPEKDLATYGKGSKIAREERFLAKTVPVPSLINAMYQFFLVVANCHYHKATQGNRSMMIHPCRKQAVHRKLKQWAEKIQIEALTLLRSGDIAQIRDGFKEAHTDLQSTMPDLASLDELICDNILYMAIRQTFINECNTRAGAKTPEIDWKGNFAHILVGGAALERGYVVKNLVISYLSRDAKNTNLDTMSQWQRCNGYKRQYAGEIRVYLPESIQEDYFAYAVCEREIHNEIQLANALGTDLKEVHRRLVHIAGKKHTRDSIISKARAKSMTLTNANCVPTYPLNMDVSVEHKLERFLAGCHFEDYTPDKAHGIMRCKLREFYTAVCVAPLYKDEPKYRDLDISLLRLLRELSEQPDHLDLAHLEQGADYEMELIMVNHNNSDTIYKRSVDESGFTKDLMSGNWKSSKRSQYHLGSPDRLRVLVHKLTIVRKGQEKEKEVELAKDKLTLSVFFPENYPRHTYFESDL
ncbi:Putative endonuclease, Z1 domain protein [Ferrimonas balearica DSM 9799]|uniref:Putative endonuclease, Z1 domain protein n=2 Tax=Ferrimonas balearica TaxID=44012 RepID=E1STX3_FERBD|nr:Putative endonuclease, Z1 domain protein [Ferrimonas balearica DSM 9799]